ncbi:MAG: hypothetical protein FJW92_01170 [Actinobacteria bacterium]|nr:hypothetical protein [Actinomycetota bacterium]
MSRRLVICAATAIALPIVLAGCGGESSPDPQVFHREVPFTVTLDEGASFEVGRIDLLIREGTTSR